MKNINNKLAQIKIEDNFGSKVGKTGGDLGQVITNFLDLGMVIASVTLLFLIIFAGIGIIGGAGKDDPKAAAQGRASLTYAIIGFSVIIGSYWIVRIIELTLRVNFLTELL